MLKKKERKFEYCEPYQNTIRTLHSEQNGAPRINYYRTGSDDSVVQTELYYDRNRKRRFAFIVARAYNGTRQEHRVYFSKTGKIIWEARKLLEGPGYTFPHEWPEEKLIRNPKRAFKEVGRRVAPGAATENEVRNQSREGWGERIEKHEDSGQSATP